MSRNRIKSAMQRNSMLLEISRSQAAATRIAKSVSPRELDKAMKHLQVAKQELAKRAAEKEANLREKKLQKLESMIVQLGLSAEDVRSLTRKAAPTKRGRSKKEVAKKKTNPRKGKKVAAKYSIKVATETYKWSGRGRMPLAFKEFVEKGGSLEECLIK